MNHYAIHIKNELRYTKLLDGMPGGKGSFVWVKGQRQKAGVHKRVVLEPGLEMEYAQPLLTLFDELLAWTCIRGQAALYFTQRAGAVCGEPDRAGISGHLPEPCTSRECRQFQAFFSAVHMKELYGSKDPRSWSNARGRRGRLCVGGGGRP